MNSLEYIKMINTISKQNYLMNSLEYIKMINTISKQNFYKEGETTDLY